MWDGDRVYFVCDVNEGLGGLVHFFQGHEGVCINILNNNFSFEVF